MENSDTTSVSTESTRTTRENDNETIQHLQDRIRRLEEKLGTDDNSVAISMMSWSDISVTLLRGWGLDYVLDAFFQTKLVPNEDMTEDGRFIISKESLIAIISCICYFVFFFLSYVWKIKKNQPVHQDLAFHGY
jgi:hypothetical protein